MQTARKAPERAATNNLATRLSLIGILTAMGCARDPRLDGVFLNRPGEGDIHVHVQPNPTGGLVVTASTSAPEENGADADITPIASGTIPNERLCAANGITCQLNTEREITEICFSPNPSDQLILSYGDREHAVNFQICDRNRRPPEWIRCDYSRSPRSTWICARN